MALPEDQFNQIKQQLIDHISSTFPEEKKASAINQIQSMNEKELEEFLVQNNLIKNEGDQQCL